MMTDDGVLMAYDTDTDVHYFFVRNKIMESPLGNVDWFGDFNSDKGSYEHPKDRKLVQNPVRLQKLLYKSPYTINIYFANIDADLISKLVTKHGTKYKKNKELLKKYVWSFAQEFLSGEITAEKIRELYGIEIPNPKSNDITFILGSGANDKFQHRLSAWMIIHRFCHSIEDGSLFTDKRSSAELHSAYTNFEKFTDSNDGIKLKYLISQGTMASARNNNFTIDEEITTELLTQFFVTGKITLKNDKETENKLNIRAKAIFDAAQGKIFIGL